MWKATGSLLLHGKDSVDNELIIQKDSLLLGNTFQSELKKRKSRVIWKLKLRSKSPTETTYKYMPLITSYLFTNVQYAKMVDDLLGYETGQNRNIEKYYQSVISSINFTYGRVGGKQVKILIDKSL